MAPTDTTLRRVNIMITLKHDGLFARFLKYPYFWNLTKRELPNNHCGLFWRSVLSLFLIGYLAVFGAQLVWTVTFSLAHIWIMWSSLDFGIGSYFEYSAGVFLDKTIFLFDNWFVAILSMPVVAFSMFISVFGWLIAVLSVPGCILTAIWAYGNWRGKEKGTNIVVRAANKNIEGAGRVCKAMTELYRAAKDKYCIPVEYK